MYLPKCMHVCRPRLAAVSARSPLALHVSVRTHPIFLNNLLGAVDYTKLAMFKDKKIIHKEALFH